MSDVTGTFNADFTPFETAVKEATITLKQFEDGAGNVEKTLTAMGNSFSGQKVIQNAILMTEAIERAGGVTTLTANELQRAGTVAAEAAEKMRALGQTVPANIQALADAAANADKSTGDLGVSFGKLVASMVTADAIVGALKTLWNGLTSEVAASVAAANEAEQAEAKLYAALRAQGTAIPSVVSAYADYGKQLQNTTIYSDDAVTAAEALLVTVGNVMPRDMQKALTATTNLASAMGKDLPEAAMLVAKAAEGQITALTRAGVVIDANKAAQEGLGYVLDQINEKFKGQAEAIAGTYQGRLAQLSNAWNNVEESIGRIITQNATVLTAVDEITKALTANTGELNANSTANDLVSEAVIAVARAVALGVEAVKLAIDAYSNLRITFDAVARAEVQLAAYTVDLGVAMLNVQKYVNPLMWTDWAKAGLQSLKDMSTQLHGMADGFSADIGATVNSQTKWDTNLGKLSTGLDAFTAKLAGTAGQTKALTPILDGNSDAWNRNTESVANNAKKAEEYARAWEKGEELIQKAWADAFVARANLDANSLAAQIDVLNTKRANDLNAAAATVADYNQLQEAKYAIDAKYDALIVNATNKKNDDIRRSNDALWRDYETLVSTTTATGYDKATKAVDDWYAKTVEDAEKAGTANAEFWDVITKAYVEKWRQAGLDVAAINKTNQTETREGLQATADAAKRQADYAITQVGHWSDETIQKYRDTAEEAQRAADTFGQSFDNAGNKAKAGVDKATNAVKELHGQLNMLVSDANNPAYFGSLLSGEASVARTIAAGKTHSPGEAAYMASGGVISGSIGGGLIGYRAEGGPVDTGKPYIVGEQGPELFIPLKDGHILPKAGATAVTVQNVFHIVDTEAGITRRVADNITRSVMRSTKLS